MYPGIVSALSGKLTSSEWDLVSYYIYKAQDLGEAGKDGEAREALKDAIAVAASKGESNTAGKIQEYLRFY